MEKRIVISGYYGSKNAGDEAMLAAMLEVLKDRSQKLHITVISSNPKDTEERHGVQAISWLSGKKIFSAIWKADLLISGGGSLLQNVTSRRSLYYYLVIISLALLLRKRVMLYAQGIGPILGRCANMVMRLVLNHVDGITVRDAGSLDELKRLGIKGPEILQTADPVLAMHPSKLVHGKKILQSFHVNDTAPIIGISVRDWQQEGDFKQSMAAAADTLKRDLGASIVYLPMKFPEDIESARSIVKLMEEDAVVLDGEYTTEEFLSIVGSMDFMIGIRLHALIFACVMQVPMLGVSYDPKVDRFLETLGEETVGELENVTSDAIVKGVKAKWKKSDCLASMRKLLHKKALENVRIALNLIKS